jgi:hypothetical protein
MGAKMGPRDVELLGPVFTEVTNDPQQRLGFEDCWFSVGSQEQL